MLYRCTTAPPANHSVHLSLCLSTEGRDAVPMRSLINNTWWPNLTLINVYNQLQYHHCLSTTRACPPLMTSISCCSCLYMEWSDSACHLGTLTEHAPTPCLFLLSILCLSSARAVTFVITDTLKLFVPSLDCSNTNIHIKTVSQKVHTTESFSNNTHINKLVRHRRNNHYSSKRVMPHNDKICALTCNKSHDFRKNKLPSLPVLNGIFYWLSFSNCVGRVTLGTTGTVTFNGRINFTSWNQQCQSTQGKLKALKLTSKILPRDSRAKGHWSLSSASLQ